MNGPEHYREAERLLAAGEAVVREIDAVRYVESRRDALGKQAMGIWAQAQVHATLAQTAATLVERRVVTFTQGERVETAVAPLGGDWTEATS